MVYGTYNYIVTGAYKPTYNWGASHCSFGQTDMFDFYQLDFFRWIRVCWLGGIDWYPPKKTCWNDALWNITHSRIIGWSLPTKTLWLCWLINPIVAKIFGIDVNICWFRYIFSVEIYQNPHDKGDQSWSKIWFRPVGPLPWRSPKRLMGPGMVEKVDSIIIVVTRW